MGIASTGASTKIQTSAAVREAIDGAMRGLGGRAPSYGFLFLGPDHDLGAAIKLGKELTRANLVASSTAGEFTEAGLLHGGVATMLVAADDCAHAAVFAKGLAGNPSRLSDELFACVPGLRRAGTAKGQRFLNTVLLTDGLAGTGEDLVLEAADRAPSGAQIVGGAAADEGRFRRTTVGAGHEAGADSAVALHVLSSSAWGVGVNHGLRSASKRMRVTKVLRNIVYEIDNAPAFEAYKRHAAERGVTLTPESAGPYMIANELGLLFFDKINRARAPLSVGADGSLVCAARIPENAQVSILDGEPRNMVEAARSAAEEARDRLEGRSAAGVVLFDCVCRGMILKDKFQQEIDAVRSVFGNVPVAGFLTYGEIARYGGKLDGWHNTTAVVAAIPA
jgi:methyl-accepting chemotaxis protein